MEINRFENENFFLSNFSESLIFYQDKIWKTVEHLYQAAKSTDPKVREEVRQCTTPGLSKKMGRTLKLRPDWEEIKEDVMLMCLILKYDQNPELKAKLLATNDATLIEGNFWHDNFFGICSCNFCSNKIEGKNILGKFLMQIRTDYQSQG